MFFFIQMAYWILLSDCLLARSFPLSDFRAITQSHVECRSDSRFYAPSDVTEACITTALDCVMRELNGTVKEECDDSEQDILDAVESLNHVINRRTTAGHARTDSNECTCERWPLASYAVFKKNTLNLLQMTNTMG
ncbi:interleukin-2 precursor [Gasterosteus aculeatus]|uniref:Interleukin n=2 Tax=Gasterosteus aculeatus TaxID=69293 RepID=A0AAQ4R0F7_GASAC|nr:interleukin-2 precursor [Gasterosteus aculeatus]ABS44953.1 interleukin-2 [Gasterosteus aculeatus]